MIKPVVKKHRLDQTDADSETIAYWMSKTPEERMDAMGELHRQLIIIQGYKQMPSIKKLVNRVNNIK